MEDLRKYIEMIFLKLINFRKEIPPETGFLVGIKMNSVEFQEKGLNSEDAVIMCKEFEVVFIS